MERFLRKHGPFSRDEQKVLIRKTHSLLKNVYTELEKHYGPFGEMGIDIAIDPKGRLWLIEGNARTEKAAIRKAYPPRVLRTLFVNPLQYARYLYHNREGARKDGENSERKNGD